MAANSSQILQAIADRVEGAGLAHAVRIGQIREPFAGAEESCAVVEVVGIESGRESDRLGLVPLNQISRTLHCELRVWTPIADPTDPAVRQFATLAAFDAVCQLVELDLSLGGRVLRCAVEPRISDGVALHSGGGTFAEALADVYAVWRTRVGAV